MSRKTKSNWTNSNSFKNAAVSTAQISKAALLKAAGFAGIRERTLLTRSNKLRVRYVASVALVVGVGLPAMMTFSGKMPVVASQQVASLNDMAPASGENTDTISGMLDGSLYGQLSLASAATETIQGPTDKIVTVEPGDALGSVMEKAGVPAEDSHEAIAALREHFDPRRLKAGQDVKMHFIPDEEGKLQFAALRIEMDPVKTVNVEKIDAGFRAALVEKEVNQVVTAKKAVIKNSLSGAAEQAGIPQSVVNDAIKIYSWNIDFQRDIRKGDSIEIMYDNYQTEDGYVAKAGEVLYAKLILSGREIPLYRYKMKDGSVDYFGPDGRSIKRTLMKTPINGARLSSGFGMRRHPVLGYGKMHKGIDFAAPTGTPIYAAGDGVVEYASRFSSYGNYVRIRHNSGLKTAYAHMHRISVKNGQRVKQGEVIGSVGTTGRSTGPHLHYEILVNGKQVNPRGVNLPTGQELAGAELKEFKAQMRDHDMRFAKLSSGIDLASFFTSGDNAN